MRATQVSIVTSAHQDTMEIHTKTVAHVRPVSAMAESTQATQMHAMPLLASVKSASTTGPRQTVSSAPTATTKRMASVSHACAMVAVQPMPFATSKLDSALAWLM